MIRYALHCAKGHDFESWFQDSSAFDKQAKRGLVTCPHCGSAKVEKAIMAPRINAKRKSAPREATLPAAKPEPADMLMSVQDQTLRAKIREIRDHITANAENVGETFPDQARKMHHGEIEHRPIYGQSTPVETRALIEEGVEIMPLPSLPDERN